MNVIFPDSFLSKICKEVRLIYKASPLFSEILNDEIKDKVVVGDNPIDIRSIVAPYAISVHHQCEEIPVILKNNQDDQGIEVLQGTFYIDTYRKTNPLEANVFDNADAYAHTALTELRQAEADLNSGIMGWKFSGKRLWLPDKNKTDSEKNIEISDPLLYLVVELRIDCFYGNEYTQMYGL